MWLQVFDGTFPIAVPVSPGANMLPSVVAFSGGDEISVGGPAKRCRPELMCHPSFWQLLRNVL